MSLGSQPIVSTILKDCNLNKNTTIFDNIGDLYFKTLINCLNTQFKDFFPPKSEIQVYGGMFNIIGGHPYTIIKDKRNGTLFYDVLPVGKKIDTIYNVAKARYKKLGEDFTQLVNDSSYMIFVRQMFDDNNNNTIELNDTLSFIYPSLKFYIKHDYAGLSETKCYDFWKSELCGKKI
tara:strand:- start:2333 stop:2863 length:531 start_codon:yes stop_codon:yes gene_type:complete